MARAMQETTCDGCGKLIMVDSNAVNHNNCVLALCLECGPTGSMNPEDKEGSFSVAGILV